MKYDAYRIEILREQYEDSFESAQQHRREGRKEAAARAYADAATTLSKLDEATDEDRAHQVKRLERAADILRRGEDLEDHFKRNQEPAGDQAGGGGPPAVGSGENDEMRAQMESFIAETETTWADIGGLDDVQHDLKRAVALGSIANKPDAVSATERILLFGPPGTGKTLLASAVAGSLDANFFKVELGNLLSKWYGESSKQISALFETAAELSPSVVFLDEVDSLAHSRDGDMNETSRRVLDTLLAELDGVEKGSDDFVLTLAATNTPWILDSAIRSRFPKRIHVPLPDVDAATEIIRIHTVHGGVAFGGHPGAFVDQTENARDVDSPERAIARRCVEEGYTGRDMEALCSAAVNNMVTRHNPDLAHLVDESVKRLRSHTLDLGRIEPQDVTHAFATTSPSLPEEDVARFYDWDDEYGSRT
ncbi:AAA family ATPase [Haloarchaeobius sp. DYHT-AS-18]|uniref:AAA family ATPase n=1 Tax=Haloarchaeobius sp. DYHT-AS-18 TaxID=3446117 RepID=UPI003EB99362